jgi:hypothetical protein
MNGIKHIRIRSYRAFLAVIHEKFSSEEWVFRGQEDSDWNLVPSLERAMEGKLARDGVLWQTDEEFLLLTEFKRRAYHYVSDPPEEDDELEWLALMQHHGAPTRLLDWTKSPYVGLFFAVVKAPTEHHSALWVVNRGALERIADDRLSKFDPEYRRKRPTDLVSRKEFSDWFRKLFLPYRSGSSDSLPAPSVVLPLNPFRMNIRMTIQQGLFLVASSINQTGFHRSLETVLSEAGKTTSRDPIIYKLEIECDAVPILRELASMNITYATLQPGLDGFAKSLGTRAKIAPRQQEPIKQRHGSPSGADMTFRAPQQIRRRIRGTPVELRN